MRSRTQLATTQKKKGKRANEDVKSRAMASPALKIAAAAAVSAAGAAVVTSKVGNDEGTQRSIEFWKNIFPIYIQYRYVQLLHRDLGVIAEDDADRRYKELHERYSEPIRDLTYRMRGFYLKQAQLMSTQAR